MKISGVASGNWGVHMWEFFFFWLIHSSRHFLRFAIVNIGLCTSHGALHWLLCLIDYYAILTFHCFDARDLYDVTHT